MDKDYFNVEWRTNDAPQGFNCMLCHHYISDTFFLMPRCSVCSPFYTPCSVAFARKFAAFNNFNMSIPDEITEIIVLGKGTKKLADRLKHNMDYLVFNFKGRFKLNLNGYTKFKEFIEKLGGFDAITN